MTAAELCTFEILLTHAQKYIEEIVHAKKRGGDYRRINKTVLSKCEHPIWQWTQLSKVVLVEIDSRVVNHQRQLVGIEGNAGGVIFSANATLRTACDSTQRCCVALTFCQFMRNDSFGNWSILMGWKALYYVVVLACHEEEVVTLAIFHHWEYIHKRQHKSQ